MDYLLSLFDCSRILYQDQPEFWGYGHLLYPYTAERRDVLGFTSPKTKRFPDVQDILRAERNLEVGGDVQPNASRLEAVYGHSLIINPSLGMYQEIHPYEVSSTYSVEINTSLPMMRECVLTGGRGGRNARFLVGDQDDSDEEEEEEVLSPKKGYFSDPESEESEDKSK